MATGVVGDLWRWPVLGMLGEQLSSTRVDALGVAGDRVHVVRGPRGLLTAADAPRLGAWTATYPFTPDGAIDPANPPFPNVAEPGGEHVYRWGDPWLSHALERELALELSLVRDLTSARGVIVSTAAPADPGRAGVNLRLELAAPAEGGWAGKRLEFEGGVELELVASAASGPGIEARVLIPGRVGVGERVSLG
jgi:hypothetical protein